MKTLFKFSLPWQLQTTDNKVRAHSAKVFIFQDPAPSNQNLLSELTLKPVTVFCQEINGDKRW